MKLKSIKNDKLKESSENKEYPIFCFKFLTTNNKFNFNYFTSEKEIKESKSIILDEIIRLQTKNWIEWGLERKSIGYESIPITKIKFRPNNMITTNDMKVIVFRVFSQKWRIIGIKSPFSKGVLHIIGFDFDYSAYNHG